MPQYRPFSRATWSIYLFLLAFRAFIAISPGYIHPDEFFQSAEITAGAVFDLDVNVPWEYKPELPCRSILIPAITTGIPYQIWKSWIGNDLDRFATSKSLFMTQRIAFLLLSTIIDWTVVRMARQIKRSPSIALLLTASSYVTIAYHTHPFSNTVESLILALSAVVLGMIIQDHESSSLTASGSSSTTPTSDARQPSEPHTPNPTPALLSFTLGVLFSLGIFTRITFVLYGFPLGVMFLYLNMKATLKNGQPSFQGLARFILACIPLAIGLGLMSAVAIVIDSIYFQKLTILDKTNGTLLSVQDILSLGPQNWANFSFKGSLTFTMLNNLQYNMNSKNLEKHGLHPRFFHLFLNFPVLFLNLAWVATVALLQKVRAGQWTSESRLVTALSYSGIFGIAMLSAMPHQEARFLTPLLLPLVVSLSGRISRLGRKFWPLWLVANGVLAIVFGLFHQGGLVPAMEVIQQQALGFQGCKPVSAQRDHMLCLHDPSLAGQLHVDDGMSYTTHVVFYKTYLPPHHLLGYRSRAAQSQGVTLRISDWREKSRSELLRALNVTQTRTSESAVTSRADRTLLKSVRDQWGEQAVLFRKIGPTEFERTVLIAPSTVDFSGEDFYDNRDTFSRHANFDHILVMLQDPLHSLHMNMFYI
ncbi:GPI mannosyltransferase 4 [Entomortierella parvispora]|uniref:Mannosyltransferase n=1 Tax=Entomortierella parvispora TaxID=205924 RepID=A0A9P3H368_9FUNG|nr:GPI mannosyltransferase 4 [Entomortierella parvispora]